MTVQAAVIPDNILSVMCVIYSGGLCFYMSIYCIAAAPLVVCIIFWGSYRDPSLYMGVVSVMSCS